MTPRGAVVDAMGARHPVPGQVEEPGGGIHAGRQGRARAGKQRRIATTEVDDSFTRPSPQFLATRCGVVHGQAVNGARAEADR